jgi:hypothetical protein
MCLVVLAALFGPRAGTVLLWLFTDRMSTAYHTGVVPVLGFFFMPWTTFLYGLFVGGSGNVGAIGVIAIVLGVLADLFTHAASFGASRRRR